MTFHVLRHTFPSLLIDQGHDVVFVSRQLGHANPSITLKVYAHLFDHERHAEQARERLQTDYGDLLRSDADVCSRTRTALASNGRVSVEITRKGHSHLLDRNRRLSDAQGRIRRGAGRA